MHLAVQCVRAAGFGWGALLHLFLGPPVPHALVEAWSEVNHDVWPPLPRRSPRPEIAQ
jgi:hypothetical protein